MRNKMGKIRGWIFLLAAMSMFLTACGKTTTTTEDLSFLGPTQILSREEGSGTRAEFETLLGTDGKGTTLLGESTEEIIKLTAVNQESVGYVAYSSAVNNSKVKILAVNDVKPSKETIKKEKYPLCRNYYIAYNGKLNAVETDFLAFVKSAGQDIVGKYCIPLKNTQTFLSDRSGGKITVEGSSSMAPILTELAEVYKKYNPNAKITVKSTDSGEGLTAAIRGNCDFAMSSRSLKSYEAELLTTEEIGIDGIVLIVNSKNPLTGLTKDQIKKLYEGSYKAWSDIK